MSIGDKQYLGDGLYVSFDGFHFVLTTERMTIYLDDQTFPALVAYANAINIQLRAQNAPESEL